MIFHKLESSTKKGIGFGITSGIITTLGVMMGLFGSTESRSVVISGILVIALADALSDALGIHIAEEFSKKRTIKQIWSSTTSTFFSKAITALIFIVPVLVIELKMAIIINISIGLLLTSIFSYIIATQNNSKPIKVIFEHLGITTLVIILTYLIGESVKMITS